MDGGDERPIFTRAQALLAAALVATSLFAGLGRASLWDQDEAACAGFARTMLRTGDWVVPRFTWSDVHRKPPLLFWSAALSFRAAGESEWALRLPSLLALVLTLGVVAYVARPFLGRPQAQLAALALGTSWLLPSIGKIAGVDVLLLLFETAAAIALHQVLAAPAWRWTLLFWGAVALGVLANGPPALALAGGLGAFALVFDPRRRNLVRLHPWLFLPLALSPVAAWGGLAWVRTDGALIRWMIEGYAPHAPRAGADGVGSHLVTAAVALLPWSTFLPGGVARLWTHRRDPAYRFLGAWLLFGSVSTLGALPPLAFLIGIEAASILGHPDPWARRSLKLGALSSAGVTLLVAGALAALAWAALSAPRLPAGAGAAASALYSLRSLPPAAVAGLAATSALLAATALVPLVALSGGRTRAALLALALGPAASTGVAWTAVVPSLEPLRGAPREIARTVEREAAPAAEVLLGKNLRSPSLAFYLGRTHARVLEARDDAALAAACRDPRPRVLLVDDAQRTRLAGSCRHEVRVGGWSLDPLLEVGTWVLVNDAGRGPAVAGARER